ncbi:HEPN domain-containing protein [Ulvibacterium marinum]|uniref:DUF1311 domain-containing protein n=1 Tax=Ulvibacterium marinum TaxID=2419782 RepID=A0A3B0C3Z6_9FLAO|nr:HEPN domain-containing protein [Ulvibacterium marinum]RKN80150.1 DUF1311 domain-containing protein [Ulvibacterium marinum]
MRKRDIIKEITAAKNRSEFYGRSELQSRFFEIDFALNELSNGKTELSNEFLRYIPITIVACFESFFRTIVSELIEFGEPYTENVLKFNQTKSIKFDFNIVNEIQRKTITVGDFIAHFLSCNNLADFNSNLSILTQTDFLNELKNFKPKGMRMLMTGNSEKFRNNFSRIITSIKKAFELRHIFCHEYATKVKVEYEEVKLIYEDCKIFLNQVDGFIVDLIYPYMPITKVDIKDDLEKSESELAEIVEKVKNLKPIGEFCGYDNTEFDEVINKWKTYRNAKADLECYCYDEPSLQPIVYLDVMVDLTRKMIVDLNDDYELKKPATNNGYNQ